MADEAGKQVVAQMLDATCRRVGAAMGEIVTAHGMGASTPIAVNVVMDDGRTESVNTTPGQLLQQIFEALVDLTGAVDDLIEALPSNRKPAPKRRTRKK